MMTYPSQQPGPHGRQLGGAFPPSGPPPRQGGYAGGGQPYDQPGDFGGGPGGTRQFAQPGTYGQQPDSYGQQQIGYDPYRQQGGSSGGEPPRKKKTGLIIGIAIAAMAVVGGVVALVVTNSGVGDQARPPVAGQSQVTSKPANPASPSKAPSRSKPPSSSGPPSSAAGSAPAPGGKANVPDLADAVLAAYNSGDGKAVADSVCRSISTKSDIEVKPGLRVETTGSLQETGDTAKLPIKATIDGKSDSGHLGFKKESELWCFSGPSQN